MLSKKLNRKTLEELAERTKLKPKEVKALYSRYRRLAPKGYLLPEDFRQTMGVLGMSDDSFIPDRMFQVFDTNQDGKLSFQEFACALALMIRGTEDEKLTLSFKMAAGRTEADGIEIEDFLKLVQACNTMLSSLVVPVDGLTSAEDAMRLFQEIACVYGDAKPDAEHITISLEAYKEAARQSDGFHACLGLSVPTKSPVKALGTVGTPAECPMTPSTQASPPPPAQPSPPPPMSPNQSFVPKALVEELQERVRSLKRVAQEKKQGLAAGADGWREPTISETVCQIPELPAPGAEGCAGLDDEGERWWWSPFDCCRASGKNSLSASAAAHATSYEIVEHQHQFQQHLEQRQQLTGAAIGDVMHELDGLIEWCETAHGFGTVAAEDAASSALWIPPTPKDAGDPCVKPESTPPQNTPPRRLSLKDSCAPSLRASTTAALHVHNASRRSMTMSESSSRGRNTARRHRQHRLLGPKKGLAVHFGHENWNMVVSMMIGIRMAVGRVRHEVTRELAPVDFIMKEKFSIIPRLANIFDSAVSKRVTMTRFIDYAPMVFQRIRTSFGIRDDDYLRSVGPEQLLGNMVLGNLSSLSELSSEGKSGAFFYYTADGKYMMKTVNTKEHALLKNILKGYYDHIATYPGTMICRFLGLHALQVRKKVRAGQLWRRGTRKIYFVVMANVFNTPYEIHRRYDLKGSWVGRQTHLEQPDPSVALKDVDFQLANESIRVGEDKATRLLTQIEHDTTFLRDKNIIDYSLLLGICDDPPVEDDHDGDAVSVNNFNMGQGTKDSLGKPDIAGGFMSSSDSLNNHNCLPLHQRDRGGVLANDRTTLYFFTIIDILTPYDSRKKVEHHIKALRYNRQGVSCCPPAMYADRFNRFMKKAFL